MQVKRRIITKKEVMNMAQGCFRLRAAVLSSASVVGGKEHDGPLGDRFDLHDPENLFGQKTWEGAESESQRMALRLALSKAGLRDPDVDALFAGDLLNQCVGSAYGLLSYDIPFFGLYGACSTSAEGLLLASMAVSGGFCATAGVVTSSHYCSAERQYRTPLEYGAQRAPTAQWTVTGAGAFLLGHAERYPQAVRITGGIAGKAQDFGINDPANMGAAMAPAAVDTLLRWLEATGQTVSRWDRIVTGDLGFEGGELFCSLAERHGVTVRDRYADCGQLIYNRAVQDVHAGGSGCGCAGTVLPAYFLPLLESGELSRILFLATGAMMSPDSIKQGENIPAIAHLIELCGGDEKNG